MTDKQWQRIDNRYYSSKCNCGATYPDVCFSGAGGGGLYHVNVMMFYKCKKCGTSFRDVSRASWRTDAIEHYREVYQ